VQGDPAGHPTGPSDRFLPLSRRSVPARSGSSVVKKSPFWFASPVPLLDMEAEVRPFPCHSLPGRVGVNSRLVCLKPCATALPDRDLRSPVSSHFSHNRCEGGCPIGFNKDGGFNALGIPISRDGPVLYRAVETVPALPALLLRRKPETSSSGSLVLRRALVVHDPGCAGDDATRGLFNALSKGNPPLPVPPFHFRGGGWKRLPVLESMREIGYTCPIDIELQ
jgi:hypothetical protein